MQIDGAQSAGAVLPGITITSFQQGDTIDLTGIAYGTPNSIGPIGFGELPFTEGGVTYDLQLAGNYTGQTFYLSPDSAGPDAGTDITVVPCYCRGTRIDTERGETAVEKLKIGNKVKTMSGVARPIKWIGKRSYGGRFIMGRKKTCRYASGREPWRTMCRGATFGFRRTMQCISTEH